MMKISGLYIIVGCLSILMLGPHVAQGEDKDRIIADNPDPAEAVHSPVLPVFRESFPKYIPIDTPGSIESVHRQIQYSFTLQNKSNRLLEKAEFWTYAPVKETPSQRTLSIEASHPYELIEDDLGNQVLYFRFENLLPYGTKIITVKADLELSDTPLFSSPSLSSLPMDISFLKAEKYIESNEPEILQLAERLRDIDPVKTAKNVFHWIIDNIRYTGYLRDERGALYAMKSREGDCTEFMDLFIALLRANNIPARGIGGYVVKEDTILKPYEYHNWAEFYDNGVWRIADPQKRVFMKDQSHYIAMRIISESSKNPMGEFDRFRFAGEGMKVKMNK